MVITESRGDAITGEIYRGQDFNQGGRGVTERFSKAVTSNFRLKLRSGLGLERQHVLSKGRVLEQVQEWFQWVGCGVCRLKAKEGSGSLCVLHRSAEFLCPEPTRHGHCSHYFIPLLRSLLWLFYCPLPCPISLTGFLGSPKLTLVPNMHLITHTPCQNQGSLLTASFEFIQMFLSPVWVPLNPSF